MALTDRTELILEATVSGECHACPRVKPIDTDTQVQHVVLDRLATCTDTQTDSVHYYQHTAWLLSSRQ